MAVGAEAADSEGQLRRRLAEAEETLRAIRDGEVDAFVVRGADNDEVFALGGQDGYRAFMEAMDIGAAALDGDLNLLYANAALCSLLGRTPQELQTEGLFAVLGKVAGDRLRGMVETTSAGRHSGQIAFRGAHRVLHLEASVAPMALGFGNGHAITINDVTDRIEAAAAHETDRIGRAIMTSTHEAIIVCRPDGIITHANAAVHEFCDGPCVGRPFDEVFDLDLPLHSGFLNGTDLIGVVMSGTAVRKLEAELKQGSMAKKVMLNATPLRQPGSAVQGSIVAFDDVTERRESERRQALLNQELNHRVRNTLTLVISIANRTVSGATDLAEFRDTFGERLRALSSTHDLLAEGSWTSTTVADLLKAELAPYLGASEERVAASGLDFQVTSDTAVSLGLILHELVTNAVKYGALSNETGTIAIDASAIGDDSKVLTWKETGGPPVRRPERLGFGQTLISKGLSRGSGRSTEVDFNPDGLTCRVYLSGDLLEGK